MAAVDRPRRRASSPSVQMMMDLEEDRHLAPANTQWDDVKNFADEDAGKDVAKILCGNLQKKGYGGLDAPKPAPAIIKKMGMDDESFSRQTTEDASSVGVPWSRETTPFSTQTTAEAPLAPTAEPEMKNTYDKPRKRASSPSMQMMQDFEQDRQTEDDIRTVRRSSKFVDDDTAKDVTKILLAQKGL